MKKIITLLACLSFLTLASCSSASESSVSEESVKSETTTAATTETATEKETTEIKETTAENLTELFINSDDLSEKIQNEYFSMLISKNWTSYMDDNDIVYELDRNASMTIKIDGDRGYIYRTDVENPTNEDYIQYKLKDYDYDVYSSINAIKFLCDRNDEGSYYKFQFFNNGKVIHFIFHAYSHHFFSEKSVRNFIDTISLVDKNSVNDEKNVSKAEITTKKITEKPTEPSTKPQTEPITTKQNLSVGQENALKKAKRYIETMPMSFDGLVEQLEYEGYSSDEARYGAENCEADWNEQAIKTAKKYIDLSGFSYSSLVEQLEYEKFTHDQATYGADNCGADWNAEAAKAAKKYMDLMPMSREQLIEQLLYEGYTNEQAEYGASSVGY